MQVSLLRGRLAEVYFPNRSDFGFRHRIFIRLPVGNVGRRTEPTTNGIVEDQENIERSSDHPKTKPILSGL